MQKFTAALPDVLILAGGCAIAYGAGLLHPAAGFITGGVLAVLFGQIASSKAAK